MKIRSDLEFILATRTTTEWVGVGAIKVEFCLKVENRFGIL